MNFGLKSESIPADCMTCLTCLAWVYAAAWHARLPPSRYSAGARGYTPEFSFFMVHTEAASDEGGKFDVVCSAKKREMRLCCVVERSKMHRNTRLGEVPRRTGWIDSIQTRKCMYYACSTWMIFFILGHYRVEDVRDGCDDTDSVTLSICHPGAGRGLCT